MTQTKSRPDWVTVLLLALMLTMTAWTVAQADWAPGLELLQTTAIAGLLLGVLLSGSSFRSLTAHVLALGYGAAWIGFTSIAYLPRAVGLTMLNDQIAAIGRHIGEWVWLLMRTGVGKDNFMFLLALMMVFWLVGYLAAWSTFRITRVMRSVLPAGLVILINLYYYGGRAQLSIFLYGYFICVLLYLVRVNLILREREWQMSRVGFDRDDVRGSFLRGGSIVTAVAVVAAWITPELAPMPQVEDLWTRLSKPIRSIEDGFNRMFSALEGSGPAMVNPFGRTLGFAGPRNLGDTVMMDVYVEETPDNSSALARYWRAGTYDLYTTNGWRSLDSDTFVFSQNTDPLTTPYLQRVNVKQTYIMYFPRTSLLIATSQPVYFDRDAEADAQLVTQAASGVSGGKVLVDPSFVYSRDALRAGDTYEAISALSTAEVSLLRTAGTQYPAWIADRYLQLPDDFPQRVKDLAEQIVTDARATNSFDQAVALESWLRSNIVYDDKIPGPRPGQDGVDYVLFESRAGYCDYYAAAMATMARSLGMPARVAVGYAKGEFDFASRSYRVRERDAHSWVEVYFPNYGWIEFEPTSAQPQIARPVPSGESVVAPTPAPELGPDEQDPRRRDILDNFENDQLQAGANRGLLGSTIPDWLLLAVGLVALGAVFTAGTVYMFENRGLRHLAGAKWAYARLVRLARWLRVDLHAHQTPYEQAALLRTAAPENHAEIDDIAGDYVRETFAHDDSGMDRSRLIWRRVHTRLWWVGLKRRVFATIERRRHPDFLKLRFPGK